MLVQMLERMANKLEQSMYVAAIVWGFAACLLLYHINH
jgi:hypothetical protein